MTTYIVEKSDGSWEPINAGAMMVEAGHLLAKTWGDDRESIAAWAPGSWVSFRERATEPTIERQRMSADILAAARDALPAGALRDWAEQELTFAKTCMAVNERAEAA